MTEHLVLLAYFELNQAVINPQHNRFKLKIIRESPNAVEYPDRTVLWSCNTGTLAKIKHEADSIFQVLATVCETSRNTYKFICSTRLALQIMDYVTGKYQGDQKNIEKLTTHIMITKHPCNFNVLFLMAVKNTIARTATGANAIATTWEILGYKSRSDIEGYTFYRTEIPYMRPIPQFSDIFLTDIVCCQKSNMFRNILICIGVVLGVGYVLSLGRNDKK